MINIKRTDSLDKDFQNLVKELDNDLMIRDGEEHLFYNQFNKIDSIKNAVVAYEEGQAIGCGAIREFSEGAMEVKRMYVLPSKREQGVAAAILKELETWARELNYKSCVLETGKKQPEAIAFYKKNNYKVIPSFGQYLNVDNSVCFEKELPG
ncbi:MAG: GNAT family N-acetyltransferase [Ginsengibacter sp.]